MISHLYSIFRRILENLGLFIGVRHFEMKMSLIYYLPSSHHPDPHNTTTKFLHALLQPRNDLYDVAKGHDDH